MTKLPIAMLSAGVLLGSSTVHLGASTVHAQDVDPGSWDPQAAAAHLDQRVDWWLWHPAQRGRVS